jgi:hypothetical protein
VTEYPWYDEVAPDEPLMQGDVIDACPVLVFDRTPEADNAQDFGRVVDALADAHGVQAASRHRDDPGL